MDNTKIEWCDATWNPVRGCTKVSEGCKHCYAEAMARRFCKPGQWGDGIATRLKGWTGRVSLDEKALLRPLRWKKPRRIFVTSLGDPFHGAVHDVWLDRMLAVMALTPQHSYLLLTKRAETMRGYFMDEKTIGRVADAIQPLRTDKVALGPVPHVEPGGAWWPLPNLWVGVSVENQQAADERLPLLLRTEAAKHFVSCEPLLGPVVLDGVEVDWVIAGGESGRHARPMHPDWVRGMRDQCASAGVPFLFKQWGEWSDFQEATARPDIPCHVLGNKAWHRFDDGTEMLRIGKKKAGRLLDGKIHHDFPKA